MEKDELKEVIDEIEKLLVEFKSNPKPGMDQTLRIACIMAMVGGTNQTVRFAELTLNTLRLAQRAC